LFGQQCSLALPPQICPDLDSNQLYVNVADAVNVSEQISVWELQMVSIGSPRTNIWFWVGTSLKQRNTRNATEKKAENDSGAP